jgi:hypothetical protein
VEELPHFWTVESARQRQKVTPRDHTEELEWRHLNVFEHRCVIRCALPRAQRPDGRVYRVRPPWEGLGMHFTQAFEAMAILLMRQMPVNAAARIIGETDKRLWRMLHAHVAAAYPKLDFSGVTCVGCDGMSVRKGHHYISVFCDLVGRCVLFACAGKDKSVWEKFTVSPGEHNGHWRAVKEVSIDMSPAYIAGVRENIGAQAVVVFDKFHVIAKVNEAMDATRRAEQRLGKGDEIKLLKGARRALLKNPANLAHRQREHYNGLLKSTLCAVKAHRMRLALQEIYKVPDAGRARSKLQAWCRWVRWTAGKHLRPLFEDMLKCAAMVGRHLEGILGHWRGQLTNAFMEGLNSVFSAVKRKARGFRSVKNLTRVPQFTRTAKKLSEESGFLSRRVS